jgi:hypothetical protein
LPNAIRDAIALAIFEHDNDRQSVDLVLQAWHYKDTEPLIAQLASLVGSYASHVERLTDQDSGEELQRLALLAAADPRCAA